MKIHEITTSKGEFFVVDMDDIEGIQKELQIYGHDEGLTQREYNEYFQHLSKNNKLICKLSEATEEDAKLIVDEPERFFNPTNPYCVDDIVFTNYSGGGKLWSALDSLHSLLTSKGIDINNGNWYLFKKV